MHNMDKNQQVDSSYWLKQRKYHRRSKMMQMWLLRRLIHEKEKPTDFQS